MSIEIRPPQTDAEWERHSFIAAYAFNGDRGEAGLARRMEYYDRDWALAAFDGGEMVAGLVVIPFEQYFAGATVPTGGVASVSCLPERRRGGYVGQLLRHSLESMRDAGQPLSMLWTPHASLYRRFGWEIACRMTSYAFPPKTVRPRRPTTGGRWTRVDADAWPRLDALYAAHQAPRIGAFRRTERHWRRSVFQDFGVGTRDAAVWQNDAGEDRAYVVYTTHHRYTGTSPFGETTLRVIDWAALDGDAYAAVLAYVTSHDLSTRIVMTASADDALLDAIEEPAHLQEPLGSWIGPMLRVVDVERAVAARPAAAHASGAGVTIELTDDTASWNAGRWRIEAHDGLMCATPTMSPAELELDARALAPIYNGFVRPAEAVRVGAVRAASSAAIDAATALFATPFSPFCPDDF
ncbi:MAG: GNAT family N-acetyltransferase [Dehalococcoidia bacterium]|nr:MAG: GNAT family N-acetyltransferase [Dehalococcoidia bacterium]